MNPFESFETFEQFLGGLESLATVLAIVLGGFWTHGKFFKEGEHLAALEIKTDLQFIVKQEGYWIVALRAFVENNSKTVLKIKEFEFTLDGLDSNQPIVLDKERHHQVHFPKRLAEGHLKPKDSDRFSISPGTTSSYSFTTRVPETMSAIALQTALTYGEIKEARHIAEMTMRVPSDEHEALMRG